MIQLYYLFKKWQIFKKEKEKLYVEHEKIKHKTENIAEIIRISYEFFIRTNKVKAAIDIEQSRYYLHQ